jgi:hypothetical protein
MNSPDVSGAEAQPEAFPCEAAAAGLEPVLLDLETLSLEALQQALRDETN